MLSLKIVAVGDCNVGKRCLLRSYAEGKFPVDDIKNVTNGYSTTIEICQRSVKLELWDTKSDDDYARLRPLTYPLTDVFLLCFAITDPNSFHNVEKIWHPEIVRHCPDVPFVLVGTKCDTTSTDKYSKVKQSEACAMAKRIKAAKYIECSSLTGEGLEDVFTRAIGAVLDVCPNKDTKTNSEKTCTLS